VIAVRDFLIERLDGEALVYDTQTNEAHALKGAGLAEFEAAGDDVSRREVLRRLALAGAVAASGGALMRTIVTPTSAQAQSSPPCGNGTCPTGTTCCTPPNTSANCCFDTTQLCRQNLCIPCGDTTEPCCTGGICKKGECATANCTCSLGTCVNFTDISDRAVKRALRCVEATSVLRNLR
jgi:hypothetical protein